MTSSNQLSACALPGSMGAVRIHCDRVARAIVLAQAHVAAEGAERERERMEGDQNTNGGIDLVH